MKHVVWLLILALPLSACAAPFPANPAEQEISPPLMVIPVYPGSIGWSEEVPGVNQESEKAQTFSYLANAVQYETLVEFYKEEMDRTGWELMEKSVDQKTDSAELMFTHSKTVAHIQIIPWTANSYLVYIVFYEEPVFE